MDRYIGITGFKTDEEIDLCNIFSGQEKPRIMYGILTTPKNLMDVNVEGSRIASLNNLERIFSRVPQYGFPMLHHCTDNRQFVDEVAGILTFNSIYEKGLVKAVQINQRLPDVLEMQKLRKTFPKLEVVLQLEPEDLENPKDTAQRLTHYEGLCEYVIIDPSRGAGIGLSVRNTLEVLNAMKLNAMPVIAGGLNSKNVAEVVRFFRENYGDEFCIDAEGRLRTEDGQGLLPIKIAQYINRAREAYK